MDEKIKELWEKGIISISKWEDISSYEKKSEIRIGNTKIDCFLHHGGISFKIGGMSFFRLREVKIERESFVFGLEPSENENLYLVFINYKNDVVAYIPLEESGVSE